MRRFRPSPRLRDLRADRRGASTVEYGLILAFIVLMMFGALKTMATVTTNMWNDTSARVIAAK